MKSGPHIFEVSEQSPQYAEQAAEKMEENTSHYSSHFPDSFVLRSPYENPLWIRRQSRRNSQEDGSENPQALTRKSNKP
jgi:hypothetical protein